MLDGAAREGEGKDQFPGPLIISRSQCIDSGLADFRPLQLLIEQGEPVCNTTVLTRFQSHSFKTLDENLLHEAAHFHEIAEREPPIAAVHPVDSTVVHFIAGLGHARRVRANQIVEFRIARHERQKINQHAHGEHDLLGLDISPGAVG